MLYCIHANEKVKVGTRMGKKYYVELTKEEHERVLTATKSKDTSDTVKKRCNILIMADKSAGKPAKQEEIALRYGVSRVTVYQTIKDYQICGLDYVLRKRTHEKPPRKAVVDGEAEAKIIALACGEPPQGFSRWTVRLLTQRVIELKILESVGRETIRTTLKKRNLSLT